jgi:quercetin dioxygenase-like cupin family protein
MLLTKILENLGDIRGTIYDFEKSGDILGKHVHDETNVHITIVAKGKIKAYSHDWEIEAEAGRILDFRPHEPHEIMALEDNTRIVNIVKKFGNPNNIQYLD